MSLLFFFFSHSSLDPLVPSLIFDFSVSERVLMTIQSNYVSGINITLPDAPVILTNSTIRGNRGYGVVVNGSHGDVLIENTVVADNGGDGIRFVRHEPHSEQHFDRRNFYDFCMIPTTASQTYPVIVWMQQNEFNPTAKECYQVGRLIIVISVFHFPRLLLSPEQKKNHEILFSFSLDIIARTLERH